MGTGFVHIKSNVVWENKKAPDPLWKLIEGNGSGDRNRTCDTGLMSPLLYRLSYAAMYSIFSEHHWSRAGIASGRSYPVVYGIY